MFIICRSSSIVFRVDHANISVFLYIQIPLYNASWKNSLKAIFPRKLLNLSPTHEGNFMRLSIKLIFPQKKNLEITGKIMKSRQSLSRGKSCNSTRFTRSCIWIALGSFFSFSQSNILTCGMWRKQHTSLKLQH